MLMRTYRISGFVVDAKTGRGIAGLRVEAWDQDSGPHRVFGGSTTDALGRFQIAIDVATLGPDAPLRTPDVFIKVLQGSAALAATGDVALRPIRSLDNEISLRVEAPATHPTPKDRVTGAQVMSAVDFALLSDFRGLFQEGKDRTTASGSVLLDAARAILGGMKLQPVKPPSIRTNDVIGQDPQTAQRRLEAQQVTVRQVKPYKPGVESLGAVPSLVGGLHSGEKVDLYEDKGVVRGYSVVKNPPAIGAHAADVVPLENAEKNPQPAVNELSSLRADLDQLKATSQNTLAGLTQELSGVKTQVAAVVNLKAELTAVEAQLTQQDDLITGLRQEIITMRALLSDFTAKITPERIAQLEAALKSLGGIQPGGQS